MPVFLFYSSLPVYRQSASTSMYWSIISVLFIPLAGWSLRWGHAMKFTFSIMINRMFIFSHYRTCAVFLAKTRFLASVCMALMSLHNRQPVHSVCTTSPKELFLLKPAPISPLHSFGPTAPSTSLCLQLPPSTSWKGTTSSAVSQPTPSPPLLVRPSFSQHLPPASFGSQQVEPCRTWLDRSCLPRAVWHIGRRRLSSRRLPWEVGTGERRR